MYEDPTRHSLTFQSYVQLTMTQLHVKKPSSEKVNMKVRILVRVYLFSIANVTTEIRLLAFYSMYHNQVT